MINIFDVSAGEFDISTVPDQQIGSTITLLPGVGQTGDTLRVYAIKDGQYAY